MCRTSNKESDNMRAINLINKNSNNKILLNLMLNLHRLLRKQKPNKRDKKSMSNKNFHKLSYLQIPCQ